MIYDDRPTAFVRTRPQPQLNSAATQRPQCTCRAPQQKEVKISPGKTPIAGVDSTPDGLDAITSGYRTLLLLQKARTQGDQALVDAKCANGQFEDLYDLAPYGLILPTNLDQYETQKKVAPVRRLGSVARIDCAIRL